MKKRIISIFLIVSIIVSVCAIGVLNSSAVTIPPGPSKISCANKSDCISISWTKVSNASRYVLYYKKTNSSTWNRIFTWQNSVSFGKTGYAEPGAHYHFQVQSINKYGYDGGYSKVVSFVRLTTPTSFGGKMDGIRLRMYWNKVKGAQSYQLVRWNPNNRSWVDVYNGPNTSVVDNGVSAGKFIYQVRAINGKVGSGWSSQAHATVTPKIDFYSQASYASVASKTGWFGVKSYYYHYNIDWTERGSCWEIAFYTTNNHKNPSKRETVYDSWYEFDDEDMSKRYDMVVVRHKIDGTCYNSGQGLYYIPLRN